MAEEGQEPSLWGEGREGPIICVVPFFPFDENTPAAVACVGAVFDENWCFREPEIVPYPATPFDNEGFKLHRKKRRLRST